MLFFWGHFPKVQKSLLTQTVQTHIHIVWFTHKKHSHEIPCQNSMSPHMPSKRFPKRKKNKQKKQNSALYPSHKHKHIAKRTSHRYMQAVLLHVPRVVTLMDSDYQLCLGLVVFIMKQKLLLSKRGGWISERVREKDYILHPRKKNNNQLSSC